MFTLVESRLIYGIVLRLGLISGEYSDHKKEVKELWREFEKNIK